GQQRGPSEIGFALAPADRTVRGRAAAGWVAVILPRHRKGESVRAGPPGDRLALHVRTQVEPLEVAELIVRIEILRGQPRTTLQSDDFMPTLPSSAARMPPAAPTPTMTTSVFSVAMRPPISSATDRRSRPIMALDAKS